MGKSIASEQIARAILVLRGRRVLLDDELAALYGVTTKRLNEQVKRNAARFPADFIFRLTPTETVALNRSQNATGSQKHRDPRFAPYAFTEHGAIMAATILSGTRTGCAGYERRHCPAAIYSEVDAIAIIDRPCYRELHKDAVDYLLFL
jgi:ORF6N domain